MAFVTGTIRAMLMLDIVMAVTVAVTVAMAMAMTMMVVFCATYQHVLGLNHRTQALPCRNKMLIMLRNSPIAPIMNTNLGCSTPISIPDALDCCQKRLV